ncbi:MAG: hypothetical protein OEM15_02540 [Myxococcales bacterium]|nr:hypothetical protein [Myxococcales bacterium]
MRPGAVELEAGRWRRHLSVTVDHRVARVSGEIEVAGHVPISSGWGPCSSFGFLAGQECTLQQSQGLVRLLKFSLNSFGERDVIVIAGLNRWTILTNSEGRELIAGGRWVELPDATEITMTVQDADDANAPIYELQYRFDGDQFTVRSFIEL